MSLEYSICLLILIAYIFRADSSDILEIQARPRTKSDKLAIYYAIYRVQIGKARQTTYELKISH